MVMYVAKDTMHKLVDNKYMYVLVLFSTERIHPEILILVVTYTETK